MTHLSAQTIARMNRARASIVAPHQMSGTATPVPVGPSSPLRQVYPVIMATSSPVISLQRNTRFGRGVIVPVNEATAGTPVTVTHNLGRIPSGAISFVNNEGATQNPNITLGTATTRTQATITADQIMTNCLVWFF